MTRALAVSLLIVGSWLLAPAQQPGMNSHQPSANNKRPTNDQHLPTNHGNWWSCGHAGNGDCHEDNGSPGCESNACCDAVCKVMEFCCSAHWNQACADLAMKLCPPPCPGEGSCFEPQDQVGCEDKTCCEHICMIDSFCCTLRWDALCAAHAAELCDIPACELSSLPGTPEPEECTERINDGCNLPQPAFTPITCAQQYRGTAFAGAPRDTDWYRFENTQQRRLTWTVNAEFPVHLLIIRGGQLNGCGSLEVLARGHGSHCQPTDISFCAEPGDYYLFVAPGMPHAMLRAGARCPDEDPGKGKDPPPTFYGVEYHAQLTCDDCPPFNPADLNGDGVVDVLDLLILLDSWGACPVGIPCPADFNGDGSVDVLDLLFLLDNWG